MEKQMNDERNKLILDHNDKLQKIMDQLEVIKNERDEDTKLNDKLLKAQQDE